MTAKMTDTAANKLVRQLERAPAAMARADVDANMARYVPAVPERWAARTAIAMLSLTGAELITSCRETEAEDGPAEVQAFISALSDEVAAVRQYLSMLESARTRVMVAFAAAAPDAPASKPARGSRRAQR
jgi:hypothetical protein